jgi:site-specific DNA-methyltransferase (adenine-specific)
MIPFPNKKYDVIYADPPWFIKKTKRDVRPNQIEMDYPMMDIEEIKSLPVESISKNNSVLFLWTTNGYLPKTFSVMERWGFRYQRTITWDKSNGMCLFGFHHRTEFLLFGYRGKIEIYPKRRTFPTLVSAKSFRHSEKPQIFRDLILPWGEKRIELFARTKTDGWDVWGNEVIGGI